MLVVYEHAYIRTTDTSLSLEFFLLNLDIYPIMCVLEISFLLCKNLTTSTFCSYSTYFYSNLN